MNILHMSGEWDSALTQLALLGCAAIVEQRLDPMVGAGWSIDGGLRPVLHTQESLSAVSEAVVAHAAHARATWVGATHCHLGSVHGTFSPRLAEPRTPEEWAVLHEARQRWLSSDELDLLDRRMIGGMGELGYWCLRNNHEVVPSWGASPWEMKTRNKGEEFVAHRLAPLATIVAGLQPDEVAEGLSGARQVDRAGKGSVFSRTPTGLTSPRSTSDVRAWCALWGMSVMAVRPVTRLAGRSSVSMVSGAPRGRRGPYAVPALDRPATMGRIRAVMRSRHLADVATSHAQGEAVPMPAAGWLMRHGVGAVVVFPKCWTNAKTPEEWLGEGETVALRP